MTEQPIKRNRYFDPPNFECDVNGRNVDEDIQNFHLFSSQAQLASLHNWGIAQGLEVNGIAGSSTLTINSGVALDAQGRLIVLATQGRGDIGSNPPGGNHNPVAVPVDLDTSGLAQDSYYLTIEFSEILRFDDGGAGCGRLEQAPWLRLQPVSGFTDDGSSVVLAVVTLDSTGNIVSLTHQDIRAPLTRHLVGKTVGQLEIKRSQTAGNAISETDAGKLEALASGGLQLSVTSAGDQILLTEIDGNNFSRLTVQADTVATPGNVGIGTTTPTAKLEVTGNLRLEAGATVNEFSSDGTFSSNSELAVPTERAVKTYVDGEIATVNTALSTKAALNGSATEDFQTRNLTVNGNLTTTGFLDVGGDLRLRGSDIRDTENTARITIAENGRLDLKEDNGSIALSIARNSFVGIGTINPQAKLEVAGALKLSMTETLIFYNTNESGTPNGDGFRLRYDNNFFGNNLDALVVEKTDGNAPNPDGGIAFVNIGNDGVEETALVIRGNGNVGIGTTAPANRLHVNGSLTVSGSIDVTGDIRLRGQDIRDAGNTSRITIADNGDLSLRASSGLNALTIAENRNVGIITTNPQARLHIIGGSDAEPNRGGYLVIGNTNSPNVVLDDNEIMARNNGAVSNLHLQASGGNLLIQNKSPGRVAIGASNPRYTLDVRGDIGNNATRYHSDIRYKTNVKTLTNALDKVLQLRGVIFEWKQEEYVEMNFDSGKQLGVIAQEVEKVLPEIVSQNEEGYKTVDYSRLTALLIEAVKELKAENNYLKKNIGSVAKMLKSTKTR